MTSEEKNRALKKLVERIVYDWDGTGWSGRFVINEDLCDFYCLYCLYTCGVLCVGCEDALNK